MAILTAAPTHCPLCKSPHIELVTDEDVEYRCHVMVPRSVHPTGIQLLTVRQNLPFYMCTRCEWCEVRES